MISSLKIRWPSLPPSSPSPWGAWWLAKPRWVCQASPPKSAPSMSSNMRYVIVYVFILFYIHVYIYICIYILYIYVYIYIYICASPQSRPLPTKGRGLSPHPPPCGPVAPWWKRIRCESGGASPQAFLPLGWEGSLRDRGPAHICAYIYTYITYGPCMIVYGPYDCIWTIWPYMVHIWSYVHFI